MLKVCCKMLKRPACLRLSYTVIVLEVGVLCKSCTLWYFPFLTLGCILMLRMIKWCQLSLDFDGWYTLLAHTSWTCWYNNVYTFWLIKICKKWSWSQMRFQNKAKCQDMPCFSYCLLATVSLSQKPGLLNINSIHGLFPVDIQYLIG